MINSLLFLLYFNVRSVEPIISVYSIHLVVILFSIILCLHLINVKLLHRFSVGVFDRCCVGVFLLLMLFLPTTEFVFRVPVSFSSALELVYYCYDYFWLSMLLGVSIVGLNKHSQTIFSILLVVISAVHTLIVLSSNLTVDYYFLLLLIIVPLLTMFHTIMITLYQDLGFQRTLMKYFRTFLHLNSSLADFYCRIFYFKFIHLSSPMTFFLGTFTLVTIAHRFFSLFPFKFSDYWLRNSDYFRAFTSNVFSAKNWPHLFNAFHQFSTQTNAISWLAKFNIDDQSQITSDSSITQEQFNQYDYLFDLITEPIKIIKKEIRLIFV